MCPDCVAMQKSGKGPAGSRLPPSRKIGVR
jgi:hypothetical protein